MGKNLILSAITTVILAAPAWANTFTLSGSLTGSNSRIYALEQFGSGSEETLVVTGSTMILTADYSTTNLGARSKANIKYCLQNGAVFGATARGLTVSPQAVSDEITTTIPSQDGGGRVGDSCVTYNLTVGSNAVTDSAATITFTVPTIKNVTAILGVPPAPGTDGNVGTADDVLPSVGLTVTVTPDNLGLPPGSSGFQQFPPINAAQDTNLVKVVRSNYRFLPSVTPAASATDLNVLIDLDDRTMFASGAGVTNPRIVTITGIGSGERMGILVSTAKVVLIDARNLSQVQPLQSATGDRFDVEVTSSGMSFADGDRVFLSTDTTFNAESDIVLNASGTSASSSPQLSKFLPSDDSVQTHPGTEWRLYYVPAAGRTLQRDATFATSYRLNFAAATMRDASANPGGTVTLKLSGLSTRGYAYAFSPDNRPSGDRGNLRIRCEDTNPCIVFLDCYDQAGESVGGFTSVGDNIAPNAVRSVFSDDLEEMIGEWTGRLSCEVVSSGPLGVQLFTRSSSGVLVNNSYINRGAASSSE